MSPPTATRTLRRALQIAAAHPALPGHFPGNPIVPGVLLLDEVLQTIRADDARRLGGGWRLDAVKFHHTVQPEQSLTLEVQLTDGPCRFSVHCGTQLVLSGAATPTMTHRPSPTSDWRNHRERGSRLLLTWMVALSLRAGRSVSRIILYPVGLYFFLFAPTARAHMLQYLRRALGRRPRARDRLRLIMSFATVLHDRLFLLAGRDQQFEISVQGEDVIAPAIASGGIFLMGAHMGSFEILRLIGQRKSGAAVAMAMYEDNAHRLSAMLDALCTGERPEVITVGRADSVLRIQSCLEQGHLVGMLTDRCRGEEPALAVSFLGTPALFPTNSMRLAAMLRRRVVLMLGLYRGANRYHVVFELLADFSVTPRAERQGAIEAAVRRYAALLEQYCRADPYNWFNFFDFWETAAGTSETARVTSAAPAP